jgi:hypothetical protein
MTPGKDEGQPGPRWRLEERLLGTAKDQVHVVNGYVAVKNRNTRSQNAQNEDLTGCWSNEIKCKFCFPSAPVHICFCAYSVVAVGSSRLHIQIHTHKRTSVRAHTHARTHAHTHTHTHIHTYTTGFEEEADLSEQAKIQLSDRLGLCALLTKIDKVFCKHLNDHWVPKEVMWGVYYNEGDFT